MRNRLAALLMALLLLVYIALVFQRAALLLGSGQAAGVAMGVALLVLPAVALWAIGRELLFGVRTEKLVKIMAAEGTLPPDILPQRLGHRAARDAADEEFPRFRAEAEAEPQSWRAWFRLGLAYDASGDRRRAREALRQSIRLHRSEQKPARR